MNQLDRELKEVDDEFKKLAEKAITDSEKMRLKISHRHARATAYEAHGVQEAMGGMHAQEAYRENFSDLEADPEMAVAARIMERRLLKDGDERPVHEQYQDIGERLSTLAGNANFRERKALLTAEEIAEEALGPEGNTASSIIEKIRDERQPQRASEEAA